MLLRSCMPLRFIINQLWFARLRENTFFGLRLVQASGHDNQHKFLRAP
jgi:hypothetical protein